MVHMMHRWKARILLYLGVYVVQSRSTPSIYILESPIPGYSSQYTCRRTTILTLWYLSNLPNFPLWQSSTLILLLFTLSCGGKDSGGGGS